MNHSRPDSAKSDAVFSIVLVLNRTNRIPTKVRCTFNKNVHFFTGKNTNRTICFTSWSKLAYSLYTAKYDRHCTCPVSRWSTERRRPNNNDIVLLLRNNSNLPYFRRVRRASPSIIRHRSTRRMRKQRTRSHLDVSKRVTGNSPAFGRQMIRLKQMDRRVKYPEMHHTCCTCLNCRFTQFYTGFLAMHPLNFYTYDFRVFNFVVSTFRKTAQLKKIKK